MITADKLRFLTGIPFFMLYDEIKKVGYKGEKFHGSKFLGITNSGQFCYNGFYGVGNDEEKSCKVFVTYVSSNDSLHFVFDNKSIL